MKRFESRILSCGIGLSFDCYISLFYIIFSFSDPQIAFSSWLLLAKACKSDFWTHTSESEMLWLEVLQSLEGGAEAMQSQSARFKQTQKFFQKQHGDELVPATSLLNRGYHLPLYSLCKLYCALFLQKLGCTPYPRHTCVVW